MKCFDHLGGWFRFLQVTGAIPYAYSSKGVRDIVFTKSSVIKFLIYVLFSGLGFILSILIIAFDIGWSNFDFQSVADDSEVRTMDLIAMVSGLLMPLLAAAVMLCLFAAKTKDLQRFCTHFDQITDTYDLSPFFTSAKGALTKKAWPILVLAICAMLLMPLQNFIIYGEFFEKMITGSDEPDKSLKWLMVGSGLSVVPFGYLNQLVIGGNFICLMLMDLLHISFRILADRVEIAQFGLNPSRETSPKALETLDQDKIRRKRSEPYFKLTKMCFDLVHVKQLMNTFLAPFLLLNFATALTMATLLTYSAVAVFFEEIAPLRKVTVIYCLCIAIVYLYLLNTLCSSGQKYQESVQTVMINFQELIRRKRPEFPPQLLEDWALAKRLFKYNTSFTSYGYFSVNHSSFLKSASTLSAYLIVLMQFRASE